MFLHLAPILCKFCSYIIRPCRTCKKVEQPNSKSTPTCYPARWTYLYYKSKSKRPSCKPSNLLKRLTTNWLNSQPFSLLAQVSSVIPSRAAPRCLPQLSFPISGTYPLIDRVTICRLQPSCNQVATMPQSNVCKSGLNLVSPLFLCVSMTRVRETPLTGGEVKRWRYNDRRTDGAIRLVSSHFSLFFFSSQNDEPHLPEVPAKENTATVVLPSFRTMDFKSGPHSEMHGVSVIGDNLTK